MSFNKQGDLQSGEAAGSQDPRARRKADQPPQSAFGGLDGWRLYGIHFPDVHPGNIGVRK